jgi:hypothetical protein
VESLLVREEIDLANLKCRSKPFSDKEGFHVICNRCMTGNALTNEKGDYCTGCGQPFIRNLIGFDTLPLVEFTPSSHLSHKRVLECLRMDPPEDNGGGYSGGGRKRRGHQDGW